MAIIMDQTCTQANMLVAFPLTTARDKCWWNYCYSLELPDISTTSFARLIKKGVVGSGLAMVSILTG